MWAAFKADVIIVAAHVTENKFLVIFHSGMIHILVSHKQINDYLPAESNILCKLIHDELLIKPDD